MKITLPDSSIKEYTEPTTIADIALDIGPGLAKAAIAGEIDGRLVNVSHNVDKDSNVRLITTKDDCALGILRESSAALLISAMTRKYDNVTFVNNNVTEDGFFVDFIMDTTVSVESLPGIVDTMNQLLKENTKIDITCSTKQEIIKTNSDLLNQYQLDLLNNSDENIIYYVVNLDSNVIVCNGPTVESLKHLKAFALTSTAGAYWKGDSQNIMLQRIYGTAWPDKKSLDEFISLRAEAEKRDHRKIGKELDLFHFQQEAPGMVFWHRNGWTLYTLVEQHVRKLLAEYDYEEVHTPQIIDRSLWERSGHWDKFRENMFTTTVDDREYAIKPMNCPGHVQLFNQGIRSHRDLPVRISEFGLVHRNEPSGTLHGLLRARRFTQDDAHVFCTEEQLHKEIETLIQLTYKMYSDFGFNDIEVALSTRPEKRVGSDQLWDRAEDALAESLKDQNIPYTVQPGEGAFYGPKHEFVLRDSIGRKWQCGTIQIDFSMPERLNASYVSEDGSKKVPVMIHRAILGSLERFIGILIEDNEGKLPFWLSPVQFSVMNITDRQSDYALNVQKVLRKSGYRGEVDLRNEKIGYKIREATLRRVPYLIVVGDSEMSLNNVSVRRRSGEDLGIMEIGQLIELVADE